MDYIKITGLKIFAHHGVLPEEKRMGRISISMPVFSIL